jgi:hypothetical protein
MKVIVDEAAWSDLNKIGSWIAKDNPAASRRELSSLSYLRSELAMRLSISATCSSGQLQVVTVGSIVDNSTRGLILFDLRQAPKHLHCFF